MIHTDNHFSRENREEPLVALATAGANRRYVDPLPLQPKRHILDLCQFCQLLSSHNPRIIELMSRAETILEAVRLTANGDIAALGQLLSHRNNIKLGHVLRILLTYLPEGTDPDVYIQTLKQISSQPAESSLIPSPSTQPSHDDHLSQAAARGKVRRLRLLPLACSDWPLDESVDPLTQFLIHQAHKIEADTGSLDLVRKLLEPFIHHSEVIQTWMISTLLPLLRLEYDYYPASDPPLTLTYVEKMEGKHAIELLLNKASAKRSTGDRVEIARDLKGLVGPWMYGASKRKRRKIRNRIDQGTSLNRLGQAAPIGSDPVPSSSDEWSDVNQWILDLSAQDFAATVEAIGAWAGPSDVDDGDWAEEKLSMEPDQLSGLASNYAQAALATIYTARDTSIEAIMGATRIFQRVLELSSLDEPPDLKRSDKPFKSCIPSEFLGQITQAHLLSNALLRENPLTQPSQSAIMLAHVMLTTAYKLLNLGCAKSFKHISESILFGVEADARADFRKILFKLKHDTLDDNAWASVRRQLLWLHNWGDLTDKPNVDARGVFSKIPVVDMESEILSAMLDAGCLTVAHNTYCVDASPIPSDMVKETVIAAILSAYDAASNGNRKRGGVRKASDMLTAFGDYFGTSQRFSQIAALLAATHAMSFYSLTLQHGVPFQPVNIRAHKDPMALIGRILSQNSRSYTHLDDLLEIGQNLVSAGLGEAAPDGAGDSLAQKKTVARRRVIRMAIDASLSEGDFDTAYSYVVTRLSRVASPNNASEEDEQVPKRYDDISWRAAYAAGSYESRDAGVSVIHRFEQRMELLSQAILLAPPSALADLVNVWQRCESQMSELTAQEATAEKGVDEGHERVIPGGFGGGYSPPTQKPRDPSRNAMLEEAPVGLFDVARGAAAALSKNAFPLRNNQNVTTLPSKTHTTRPLSGQSTGDSNDDDGVEAYDGQQRVRKRDMVSNMVTGGLASGIGWVIGEAILA